MSCIPVSCQDWPADTNVPSTYEVGVAVDEEVVPQVLLDALVLLRVVLAELVLWRVVVLVSVVVVPVELMIAVVLVRVVLWSQSRCTHCSCGSRW